MHFWVCTWCWWASALRNSCPLSQWCHPTIPSSSPLLLLPSIFPSIRVFSNKLALHNRCQSIRTSALASILPMNISGLISFRMDRFDLLAVQGTLKSLLQHHSLKGSILWHSAFFMVQLSHPYMTTGKTIALIRWTSVNKVMSLFYNTLPRFITAFISRSKHLLFSKLQSLPWVILEPEKIKSATVSIFPPSVCHEVMGPDEVSRSISYFVKYLLSTYIRWHNEQLDVTEKA